MDTSFQKTTASDEWQTPWEIVHALGDFDLDPCASNANHKAPDFYTKDEDGLAQPWHGRVWCNPPYSQPALYQFCEKMAEHGNGILLIFARTGNKVWQEIIFPKATAVLFLRKRIQFIDNQGVRWVGALGATRLLFPSVGRMWQRWRSAELKGN